MEQPVFRQTGQVAFAETDASGWLHFPNAFLYFERAEHAFLQQAGLLVFDRAQGGWPRVRVECEFARPLRFGDVYETVLGIERIGSSSVHWCFEIHDAAGSPAFEGRVVTVRVDARGRPQALDSAERAALSAACGGA